MGVKLAMREILGKRGLGMGFGDGGLGWETWVSALALVWA